MWHLLHASPGNSNVSPDTFPGLSDAASGDSLSHLTGLAQLLLIGLLAFPIWLFGLLIGLLLPKGYNEAGAAGAAAAGSRNSTIAARDDRVAGDAISDDVSSSSSSRASARDGLSSRPLSDDELDSSTSEEDEGTDTADHAVATAATGKPDVSQSGIQPANAAAVATAGTAPSSHRVDHHTVGWAQQLFSSWQCSYKRRQQLEQQQAAHSSSTSAAKPHASPAGPQDDLPPAAGAPPATTASSTADAPAAAIPTRTPFHHQHHHKQQQQQQQQAADNRRWYVTQPDLDKFTSTLAPVEGRLMSGSLGGGWSLIMDKEVPGVVRYLSYWRPTDNGTTDYLSVTILPDATAQEVAEFNLDDASRTRWDPMLKSVWLLGSRDTAAAEQLVVWLRSFPMGFLSDRVYAGIARRTFTDPHQPNCQYGVTKVVSTPTTTAWAAENLPGVTTITNYYSAWRCRTITSPWSSSSSGTGTGTGPAALLPATYSHHNTNHTTTTSTPSPSTNSSSSSSTGSQPACELILLHHDELKVPEYLARMAIKLGMWKFVTGMVDAAGAWLEARRARVDPFTEDPHAACRQTAPPLSGAAAVAAAEAAAAASADGAAAAAPADVRLAPPGLAGCQDFDGDAPQLLSPRRFYAVPTAPDLLSLAGTDGGEEMADAVSGSWDQESVAFATFRSHLKRAAAGAVSHRRGHSMEWEPVPDPQGSDGSRAGAASPADAAPLNILTTSSNSSSNSSGPGTSSAARARPGTEQSVQHYHHHQQQQRSGGVPPGVNPLKALLGVPSAVQGTLAGEVRRALVLFLRRRAAPAAVAAAAAAAIERDVRGEVGGWVEVHSEDGEPELGVHSPSNLAISRPVRDSQDGTGSDYKSAAAAAAAGGGQGGVRDTLRAADGSRQLESGPALQRQRRSALVANVSRQGSKPGKLEGLCKVLLRGSVVVAAVLIGSMLAGVEAGAVAAARADSKKLKDECAVEASKKHCHDA